MNLKPTLDCFYRFWGLILEEFLYREVAGHYELFVLEVELISFGLSFTGILVCPYFQMMAECISVDVVENDNFFTLISIEPFVLGLYVGVWISASYKVRLTGSWDTPVPFSSNCGMLIRRFSK